MGSGEKVFVFEDVAKHNERSDCWVLIAGKVYDVTQFVTEHPGGEEVLLANSGKDATQNWEAVGHSDDARSRMKKYYIGEVDSTTIPEPKKYKPLTPSVIHKEDDEPSFLIKMLQFLVPVLILAFAFGREFLGKEEKTGA